MDEPQKHYAKLRKLETKDSIYMKVQKEQN